MAISRREFYWEWFWRSFWGPIGLAQAIGFLLFVGAGMWTLFNPESTEPLGHWLWIIPGAVFAATFAVGWFTAPYVIYRELEKTNTTLTTQLDERQRRRAVAEMASTALEAGNELLWRAVSTDSELNDLWNEIRAWLENTCAAIRSQASQSEETMFRRATKQISSFAGCHGEQHNLMKNKVAAHLDYLRELHARFS